MADPALKIDIHQFEDSSFNSILDTISNNTFSFIQTVPKNKRKLYGQFFTGKETARYMASLFNVPDKKNIKLLDPGAGSGLLTAALVERFENVDSIESIQITCYETDPFIIPLLKKNLSLIKKCSSKKVSFLLIEENYITSESKGFGSSEVSSGNYDIVISNPPYKKINSKSIEALSMPSVCYGAPNLYFLFASLSLHHLSENGELVYIIPRSWTSGAYFKRFRNYFLHNGVILHIHIFESRGRVFTSENILQETIIIHVRKSTVRPHSIIMSSTPDSSDFTNSSSFSVPYETVVSDNNDYVFLLTDAEDCNVLTRIQKNIHTLPDLGILLRTGLTVDYRNRSLITDECSINTVPYYCPFNLKKGKLCFPVSNEKNYILNEKVGLLQKNRNYVFLKRFTTKEEKQRLQCSIYLKKNHPRYTFISTDNKLNFFDGIESELSEYLVYGLYCLFNSSLYDRYYRLLNGSTQVNASEINSVPVPDLYVIESIGKSLLISNDLSQKNCDHILELYNV